jgi:hypothetical protein
MPLELTDEWSHALEQLVHAARDSAEFADDKPHGRSRSASLRRLALCLVVLDKLADRHSRS